MEFKLNKEEILTAETILSTVQEQSVELDYVLPDYYPEIFKIIKCIVTPRAASYSLNGNKLTYDISVSVKVLYCAEGSSAVKVIEQKLMYTKTAEMGRAGENPNVTINMRTDYVNCRAVNQRRIDIRGAVSAEILVTDVSRSELISDAFGMDICVKKIPISFPVNRLFTTKQISVAEDLELGMSKPSIDSIIFFDAAVSSTDKKVIANKMVAKGELCINMLYTYSDGDNAGIEPMQFTLPFSQIIDFDGIDERFDCFVDADILSCEAEPKADGEGNTKVVDCNISLMIKCSAYRTASVELAVDEYSTKYGCSHSVSTVKIESMPQYINYSGIIRSSVETADTIDCVYCARCSIKSFTSAFDKESGSIKIDGTAIYNIIVCGEDGMATSADKEDAFTLSIPADELSENCSISVKVIPLTCSYSISSGNSVDIKTDIKVCGTASCIETVDGLSDIFIDENTIYEHDDNCAVKLYFASAGESLWDIAKRYKASEDAISEENDVDSSNIADNCMLIIPML